MTEDCQGSAAMVAITPKFNSAAALLPVGCCLLPLLYFLFFYHLDQRDLWSSHEARAAQNAQGIVETGQWGLPRLFDGRVEMQKPPLYYWLVAAITSVRGGDVDAWSVRLPAAAAAVLGMVGVFVLAWRRGRPLAGAVAALILGTMLHYTWMAHVGRIDMPLTAAVCGSLAGFYLGGGNERPWQARGWLCLAYVSAAVAFLLKGPIGIVLPGLVLGAQIIADLICRETKASESANTRVRLVAKLRQILSELGVWWGIPLVLLMVVPWFAYANRQTHGEFFREFFWKHNFQRGLGGDMELDGHDHPFWFYCAHLWSDMLPWSLLLPAAIVYLIRQGRWRGDAEARFGAVWFGSMLLFLSAMQYKRPDYLLPAYPGLALLLGCVVERWYSAASLQLARAARFVAVGAMVLISFAWICYMDVVLPCLEPTRELRSFAEEVRQRVPRPGQVLGFRVDSHHLVYHLGRPFERLWEWENLDIWACQPAAVFVVMPKEWADAWPQFMEAGKLYPILSTSDLAGETHDHPLVLLCTRPIEQ
jgi:4-amino-4-deoxy-L-arabinose transferase-like glycosyltransferase